jgi:hypothetical protein
MSSKGIHFVEPLIGLEAKMMIMIERVEDKIGIVIVDKVVGVLIVGDAYGICGFPSHGMEYCPIVGDQPSNSTPQVYAMQSNWKGNYNS